MKLDPDCDVCDENGMWCDPDKIMDVPCPSCNAEPVTDRILRAVMNDDIDRAKDLHPSNLEQPRKELDSEQLRAAADACMQFAKQMMQSALYITETFEKAAAQFVEWSETFNAAANPISEPTNGDTND